ncbi:MAG: adenylate/guanylate cyclase domain-containing protein [Cyanobacteria bacterium]|nr:adenylate/guanylate cyclase domain-containing protein [Cyanobacteriota bacterium]
MNTGRLSTQTITHSVNQVTFKESLKNETKAAYVRSVMLLISSSLDVLVFFFPQTLMGQPSVPPTIALVSLTACLIASLFLIALLHPQAWRWLGALQLAIPLFDSALIALFTTNIWYALGETKPEIITNIAALCCLLAVSGGIRIQKQASVLTTVLALLNFGYAAHLFQLDPAVSVFVLFTILGTGLLGMAIAGIVQRQGKNEAGRLLMNQFLPANVVDAAFDAPNRLLDEPRTCDVTIVVTDLRGFTHYSEQLPPEAVLTFLNELQGLLSSLVEQHGGWVDKFMGDGMLAVFGAPRPLDNHAEHAVEAALAMVQAIKTISPLPIGVGIHSGPVVAGCLGMGGHLEFTVIGDTVNVAARLEALTKEVGHPMLVSGATQQRLRSPLLRSLGPVAIRGREESLEVFVPATGE